MGLFGLKMGRDSAWTFLVCAALTVSQLDFLGSGVSHDGDSPFCHFGYFSSFTALFYTNNFIYLQLFAALASTATKSCFFLKAQIEEVVVFKVLGRALLVTRLFRAGCPMKLLDREWLSPLYIFCRTFYFPPF
jgi:hypothetical protein